MAEFCLDCWNKLIRTLDILLIPVKLIFLPLILIHEIIHHLTPGR